jgi:hypothetical protein
MDNTEKAFDNAIDSSKQLITLSTGIIAFSIAFFDKEAMMKPTNSIEKALLILSWIILLSSAMVGILWTQRAFISVLKPSRKVIDSSDPPDSPPDKAKSEIKTEYEPDIRSEKIRYPLNLQSRLFLAGVIAFIAFGVVKVLNNNFQPETVNAQQQSTKDREAKHQADTVVNLQSDTLTMEGDSTKRKQ